VTFHRAVDCTKNLLESVEEIAGCGCVRILTSGGKKSGPEGREEILAMQDVAGSKLVIMPGGGIRPETFENIYHPNLKEYHLSGRSAIQSPTPSHLFDMDWAETTREAIAQVVYQSPA